MCYYGIRNTNNKNVDTIAKPLIKVRKRDKRFLRRFNAIAAVLHAAQGVAMLVLSNDFSQEISIGLPVFDISTFSSTVEFEPFLVIQLGPLVAMFLILSAIAHTLMLLPSIYGWYIHNLERKRNYARWFEYALSSSIMICLVALLSGVVDFNLLFLIFVSNALMNLFGLSVEKVNSLRQSLNHKAPTDWTEYIFGIIAGISPWIVVGIYFFTAIDRVDGQLVNGVVVEVPEFVKWIFYTLFLTFNTFAINMFLQYKKIGPWKSYLFGEKAYIVLSLTAKTILAWQIFGGTLR